MPSLSLIAEEKKPTLQEIANQKGIVCKAQGWKVHLCAAQLMQLVSEMKIVFAHCEALYVPLSDLGTIF